MSARAKTAPSPTLAQIKACCRALDGKKAMDLQVLYLGDKSSIADYFVIASGLSEPHLTALGKTAQETLGSMGATVLGCDNDAKSGWLVVDACDFIIHLFTPRTREHYHLEALWKDADAVPVRELLEP